MYWFKFYHDALKHEDIINIEIMTGCESVEIIGVYTVAMLESSKNKVRGIIPDFEYLVRIYRMNRDKVLKIMNAFKDTGIITSENRISGWVDTQSSTKKDATAKDRMRRYRERLKQKNVTENSVTNDVTTVTLRVTLSVTLSVTLRSASRLRLMRSAAVLAFDS
jgi:hypothetical protein